MVGKGKYPKMQFCRLLKFLSDDHLSRFIPVFLFADLRCWKEPLQAIQNYTQINQADRPSICTIKIVFYSWFRTFYHILAVLFEGLESRPQKIRQSDVQHVPGASKYHQNHGFSYCGCLRNPAPPKEWFFNPIMRCLPSINWWMPQPSAPRDGQTVPRLRRFLRCCFSLQGADHGGVGWFPKYGLYRLTMVKAWLDRLNPPKLFSGLFKCLALTYGLTNQKRIILATINKDKRIYLPQRKRI